jgi:hypothetical protein
MDSTEQDVDCRDQVVCAKRPHRSGDGSLLDLLFLRAM